MVLIQFYVCIVLHSFLKEFEKHFSFEQMISSMKEQHGSVYVFTGHVENELL